MLLLPTYNTFASYFQIDTTILKQNEPPSKNSSQIFSQVKFTNTQCKEAFFGRPQDHLPAQKIKSENYEQHFSLFFNQQSKDEKSHVSKRDARILVSH